MNLIITSANNHFKVKGVLNRQTVHLFKSELFKALNKLNTIVLDIEGLKDIDRYGVSVLAQLHNESISQNKKMSIVGLGCKELYDHFKSEETAA
ncbi:STAS domain-containing protein [Mangrovimonas cancribranchiae]|uniref:STAS domain-containing protein n=1 Tax=Mangrovimonas cancribranchiae TaxID=3080055 RepID=A0AAU6P7M1_9FLAO